MRLVATCHTADDAFTPFAATFDSPGGTIGRCEGNALVLPAHPGTLCRVQAVIKVDGSDCYLLNMSGMAEVRVNGRPLRPLHQVRLDPGDEVAIGAYILHSEH